ncbi:MAG TPA: MupA/Atu3671 family FMN-dependent luciferase-like monooxygenase [Thermoanaerobaculia bacterium]|nr:MupA/Atu3671 family FMN-dependent luciferase-like monooxygenase [Thermoanaerobaculia bacterium]
MDERPDEIEERLAALTPEQRELLALRARKRRIEKRPVELPVEDQAPRLEVPPAPDRHVEPRAADLPTHSPPGRAGALDFSLFFFSDDGGRAGGEKYRLLFAAARLADCAGFDAVWTPERHFQDFGGLYPNPALLSAALLASTERIAIRAGSLVLPLHDPVRVVEDWSLLDNLAPGRVGLSLAAGWHPHDFALAPAAYERRRDLVWSGVEEVRQIWRDGRARRVAGNGEEIEIRVLPRPLSPTLPLWLTSSGSLGTWRKAGELDTGILSAVHGDPAGDLAERIALYRATREERGHDPRGGRVTSMLHTYVGDDRNAVEALVRRPMVRYFRTFLEQGRALDLRGFGIEGAAPNERDFDDLAAFAFGRYFAGRSLLGDRESCLACLDVLHRAGVDEVACLVDFGLPEAEVLAGLERLVELRGEHARRAALSRAAP